MKKLNLLLKNIYTAIVLTFSDYIYTILALSFTLNFLALDYILLLQSTTIRIMATQNTSFYNWSSLTLDVFIAILFGVSSAMLIYVLKKRKEDSKESASGTVVGTFFAAVASGCPVCGAWLLPLLGIAGSLAAFPLQGLEIKLLAIGLLIFSIAQSANTINGLCTSSNRRKRLYVTLVVVVSFIIILLLLPHVPQQFKTSFQRSSANVPSATQGNAVSVNTSAMYNQVNPVSGFAITPTYGNIGYVLVKNGVINFKKFKELYVRAGSPLTKDQLKMFTKEGLDKPIVINRENSYFLLNLFWAFGLANDNPILTKGKIVQYGNGRIGDFASTGGWTIATKPLKAYYARSPLAMLTEAQQARLQKVTENTYRPCCGNSTAFPDCNHGMALLGVLELMASQGATEDQLFDAAKYFSAFWFPQQAMDVATLFKVTKGVDFKDIDARTFVSREFFSGQGWSQIRGWLNSNVKNSSSSQAPQGGVGCGVAAAPVAPASNKQVSPQGGGGCGV